MAPFTTAVPYKHVFRLSDRLFGQAVQLHLLIVLENHIVHAGSAERGLQATEPIKAGEELVKVPRQLAVVVADSDKCKYPDIIDPAFFKTCSRTEKLALVLLCEKSLGAGSSVR